MKWLTLAIFIFSGISLTAQVNLVLNGGFENFVHCPNNFDQIKYATHWHPIDSQGTFPNVPLCSPEYCHKCDTSHAFGVPQGYWYNHFSRSGNGMAAGVMYFDNAYINAYQRDYLQGQFVSHLISGKVYCITFYVTLAQASQYATNMIGVFIDNGGINVGQDSVGCASPQTSVAPQIFESAIINDTLNWVKIQGNYTANGTEEFITIGNFFDATHTDTFRVHTYLPNNISYYLIDDVSVIESNAVANAGVDTAGGVGDTIRIGSHEDGLPTTWYAIGDTTPLGYGGNLTVTPTATGVYHYVVMLDLCGHVTYDTMTLTVWPAGFVPVFKGSVIIYPNPATSELTIEHAVNSEVTIFDIVGKEVSNFAISTDKKLVDLCHFPNGIYFVQIVDFRTGLRTVRKIVKE